MKETSRSTLAGRKQAGRTKKASARREQVRADLEDIREQIKELLLLLLQRFTCGSLQDLRLFKVNTLHRRNEQGQQIGLVLGLFVAAFALIYFHRHEIGACLLGTRLLKDFRNQA